MDVLFGFSSLSLNYELCQILPVNHQQISRKLTAEVSTFTLKSHTHAQHSNLFVGAAVVFTIVRLDSGETRAGTDACSLWSCSHCL